MNKKEYIKLYDDPMMYDQWDIGPAHVRSVFMLKNILGPKVLELGCGGSGFLRLLVERGFECTAVDINKKWITLGKERLPQVNYNHSLIEDFETEERFDSVILMEVLEHVLDAIVILKKALSLLKDDGVLLITVPKLGSPWDHTDNHLRQYTKEALLKDINKAGFTNNYVWEEGNYLYAVVAKRVEQPVITEETSEQDS